MSGYADTSFVVSLYVPDVHSRAAIATISRVREPLLITGFVEVELCNALKLRRFRKDLTAAQVKAAAQAFEQDRQTGIFSLQALPFAAFEKAKVLARRHTALLGTRSLDLIHVASALTLGASGFFSLDRTQRKLAHAAGLSLRPKTRSPNL